MSTKTEHYNLCTVKTEFMADCTGILNKVVTECIMGIAAQASKRFAYKV